MSDVKISYVQTEVIKEIFPDNPDFKWEGVYKEFIKGTGKKGELTISDRWSGWNQYLIHQFENFEHDRRSCIFRSYGHDYDIVSQRVIPMPDGNTPSGNMNPMKTDLEEALLYRINSFNDDSLNGWDIFERLTGWYDVDVIDGSIVELRLNTLSQFIKLLEQDEYISRYDPLTREIAITTVDEFGNMKPIEYMFPMGIEDTDYIHYVVLETEKKQIELKEEEDIINIIRKLILDMIANSGDTINEKRALGKVMRHYGEQLRPHIDLVQEKIKEFVPTYNAQFVVEGLSAINSELEAIPFQELEADPGEGKLIETYKKISISAILKKIKDKVLKVKLNRLRPPSKGKSGGTSWPVAKGGEYSLWITTDPLESMTKTTGRLWGERNDSCENYDGCANQGPVSDVKFGNATVWVYHRNNTQYRHEIGRFTLRWGDSYRGGDKIGRDVGVEIQVYPKNDAPWGFNVLGSIGMILKDKGFLNYEFCKTPYTYLGYSDKASAQKVPITYDSKIFLKGRGEVQVADANALVETANNEKISYADAGYVITYGNAQALLSLAQNPLIWIYETPLRRLVNRSMDIEQGPLLIRFLIETDVANFDFLEGLINNLELFDDNYGNALERNGLIQAMLRHFKCNDKTHYAIREAYEGYFWDNILIGGVDELDYFALLDNNSRLAAAPDSPPVITSAPIELLDVLTDKLIKDNLVGDKDKRLELWFRFAPNEEMIYNGSVATSKSLYRKYRDFLVGMRHLIFCPNLSLQAYGKLLTHFNKIYNTKRVKKVYNNHKKHQDEGATISNIFAQSLDTVKNAILASLVAPLSSPDNWGYLEEYKGLYFGLESIPELLRYRITERQSRKTIKIAANLFKGDKGDILNMAMNPDEDAPLKGILIRNIRDRRAFEELWNMRNEYDINPYSFIYNMVDRNDNTKAGVNYMLTPSMMIDTITSLGDSLEYLKYDFDLDTEAPQIRRSMIPEVVDYILSDVNLCESVGFEIVALWLTRPDQFITYRNLIFKYAIGDYFEEGITKRKGKPQRHTFILPIPFNEMNKDTYRDFANQTANISVLEVAACGGNMQVGGLAENPNIPDDIQLQLIFPPSLKLYGDLKWTIISLLYGGDYSQYLYRTFQKLCVNENICAEALRYIIENAPSLEPLIASNSIVSANREFIDSVMKKNPLPLLKNENLGEDNFNEIVEYIMNMINKSPPIELGRFETTWKKRGRPIRERLRTNMQQERKFDSVMSKIRKLVGDNKWISYWRGGGYKKKLKLPSNNNMAPMNKSKGKPMAIVDDPILINKEQIIIDLSLEPYSLVDKIVGTTYICDDCGYTTLTGEEMDTHQDEESHEGWKENNITEKIREEGDDYWQLLKSSRIRYIKDITTNDDGSIEVTGNITDLDATSKEFKKTYRDINTMYGFDVSKKRKRWGRKSKPELDKGKWEFDITLVLSDSVNPEDISILPDWRMELNEESLEECISDIIKNPLMTSNALLKFINDFSPLFIKIEDTTLTYELNTLFIAINDADLWNMELINNYSKALFGRTELYQLLPLNNLKPTGEILEVSLSQDESFIKKTLGIKLSNLRNLQDWILSNYGSEVPIRYIYDMLDNPTADAYIIDKAKHLRSVRINEFLEYAAGLNPEALGAEEGVYVAPKAEWVLLKSPSTLNNLLIEYVEIMHPDSDSKQNKLMDDIVSGKRNIDIDQMLKVVKQIHEV